MASFSAIIIIIPVVVVVVHRPAPAVVWRGNQTRIAAELQSKLLLVCPLCANCLQWPAAIVVCSRARRTFSQNRRLSTAADANHGHHDHRHSWPSAAAAADISQSKGRLHVAHSAKSAFPISQIQDEKANQAARPTN